MLFSPAVGPLKGHSIHRSGSTPITSFWISSFFALSSTILFPRSIFWLLVIFSVIIQSGHVCPNCWLQLELCSLHGVAAPPHALPRAARPVHAHHTLCLQSSSALGRHSFPSNNNTACLTRGDCSVFLLFQLHFVVVYSAVLADSSSGTSDTTAWSSVRGRCSRSTVEVLYNNAVCCLSPLSFWSLGLYHSVVPEVFNTTSVVVVRSKTSCVPSPSSLVHAGVPTSLNSAIASLGPSVKASLPRGFC